MNARTKRIMALRSAGKRHYSQPRVTYYRNGRPYVAQKNTQLTDTFWTLLIVTGLLLLSMLANRY